MNLEKNNKLIAITFSKELASEEYIEKLKCAGTKLFVHTVNSIFEKEQFEKIGVDGIYSDYIPSQIESENNTI